ncbi:MAG TPA: DnaJ domain-containing protein [Candidatus Kapabacteria bacterium]|nr:DnaJ domain-containing protein [Candidatus Kapabacteria bacterium]
MSLNQLFERFNRIARSYAPEYRVGDDESLREAERLIADEKKREQEEKRAAEAARDEELKRLKREVEERNRAARAEHASAGASAGNDAGEPGANGGAASGHGGAGHAAGQGAGRGPDGGAAGRERDDGAREHNPASAGWAIDRARRILGVTPEAGPEEIAHAYRAGMLLHHPDRNVRRSAAEQEEAKQRAQELNAAYALLRLVGRDT